MLFLDLQRDSWMKKLLKTLILAPAAFVFVIFAVANRHVVKVSLDPFGTVDTANLSVSVPLFILLLLAVMVGVLCGSVSSWLANAKCRAAQRNLAALTIPKTGTSASARPDKTPTQLVAMPRH